MRACIFCLDLPGGSVEINIRCMVSHKYQSAELWGVAESPVCIMFTGQTCIIRSRSRYRLQSRLPSLRIDTIKFRVASLPEPEYVRAGIVDELPDIPHLLRGGALHDNIDPGSISR